MMSVAKSFTAVGVATELNIRHAESFSYSVSGTFVGTVVLEKSVTNGQAWDTVLSTTAAASGSIKVESNDHGPTMYRFRCTARASGTIVTSITETADLLDQVNDANGKSVTKVFEDGFEVRGTIRNNSEAEGSADFVRIPNNVCFITAAGAPVDGTTGDNFAGPGSLYFDITNKKVYIQTSLITTPVWIELSQVAP